MTPSAVGQRKRGAVIALTVVVLAFSLPPNSIAADESSRARTSLLPIARPLWSELSTTQQELLRALEPEWNGMPAARKRSWLTIAGRIPKLEPAEREKVEARIREWARLTPEQRQLARNNFRLAKSLPKQERVATWEQYQQMTPEQQAVLRANGWTSNTAARHAGAPTGLAKHASRPIPGMIPPALSDPRPPAPPVPSTPAPAPEAENVEADPRHPAPPEQETRE
ncbi:MAG: hypothetical protein RIS35_3372 [Pseudomonadota bacterium]